MTLRLTRYKYMKVKQQQEEQNAAIYHDNHNMRIFRESPFFKLQNKLNKSWTVKNGMYSTYLLFVGCFVVLVFNARNNQAINFLTEMSPMSPMPYTGLPQEVTVRRHMPLSSQIQQAGYKKWNWDVSAFNIQLRKLLWMYCPRQTTCQSDRKWPSR